jgi:uncharacterized protein YyaL (SSP411 family)
MLELIPKIEEVWNTRREEVEDSSASILKALQRASGPREAGAGLDASILDRAYGELSKNFDKDNGGFSVAPKFPSPHNLLFLLRYWRRSGEEQALQMVETTLKAMRRGGVYDHLGYGFHRYSTDARWRLPHFEKMLYDQALLALAYTEAFQATGEGLYADTAREILTYVLRDLRLPEGGFASAEDADSEGQEGKFYTWSYEELAAALDAAELREVENRYDIRVEGNFREEATGEQTGTNILFLREDAGSERLPASIREKLMAGRETRIRPLRDDKILTSWNGLMIAALARAAAVLQEPAYLEAAESAARFLWKALRDDQGRLLHRYRAGRAGIAGFATDYAYLIWGLIELYEAGFDLTYLQRSSELMEIFLEDFWDEAGSGGFFLTSGEAERLLVRQRNDTDGALPSAGSVALLDLFKLGRMLQNNEYGERALSLIRGNASLVHSSPLAFTFLLSALDFHIGPTFEVVIAGRPGAADAEAMKRAVHRAYLPGKVLLFRPAGEKNPQVAEIAPFTLHQDSVNGRATAYVCRDYACQLPVTAPAQMLELLRGDQKTNKHREK